MGGLDELQRQLATRSTRSSAGEWRMSSRWAWCGGAEGERQRTGSQLLGERAGGRRVSDRTGDKAKGRGERASVGGRGGGVYGKRSGSGGGQCGARFQDYARWQAARMHASRAPPPVKRVAGGRLSQSRHLNPPPRSPKVASPKTQC